MNKEKKSIKKYIEEEEGFLQNLMNVPMLWTGFIDFRKTKTIGGLVYSLAEKSWEL